MKTIKKQNPDNQLILRVKMLKSGWQGYTYTTQRSIYQSVTYFKTQLLSDLLTMLQMNLK